MPDTRLFKPLKIGNMEIKHRIGMAPLTRLRATDDRVPTPLMKDYYSQRAAVPGTLIITEGTVISSSASGGFANTPGIWTKEQIEAWRTIINEVHRKCCFIFCQLFAMGRAADPEIARAERIEIVGPSAVPIEQGGPAPRAMTITEIKQSVQDFATAAQNAIDAGFDGVEIHGANGYLIDQFIQDTSNKRQDKFGGSVENRSRFVHDILKAVVEIIGPARVGLRLSPWSGFQGMKMRDPVPQFSDVIIKARHLKLAYLHLVESRISGADDCASSEGLEFAYKLWDRPSLIAGGYGLADAQKLVDENHPEKDIVVIFGRHFIANPDLVHRFWKGLALNSYDRNTFYTSNSPLGYVDYPFSAEYLGSEKDQIRGTGKAE